MRHEAWGSLCGKVSSRDAVLWLESHVRVEGINLESYVGSYVCITGKIQYDERGFPQVIEALHVERIKRINPDIDSLVGIVRLDSDSVEAVRRIREKWN